MQIRHVVLGEFQTNTYLIVLEDKTCILIDPAEPSPEITHILETEHLRLDHIWLTHGHVDHIKGLQSLLDQYHPQLACHRDEEIYLKEPEYNMSYITGNPIRINYTTHLWTHPIEDIIVNHQTPIKVIHTPGHTPGGVCYYFSRDDALFSGDTIFMGTIGRTDLPGGDISQLETSISTLKKILPDQCRVFPGHGINTVWQSELRHNPYLQGNLKEMD